MRKLILKNSLSPGDLVMLTAAVRDLHRSHPGKFLTDVRTSCGQVWESNPYLTKIDDEDPNAETVQCEYPLINRCNTSPYHFVHGFIKHLSETLRVSIEPTDFKGDIHLSHDEKQWISQVQELTGEDTRFWIIVAGGKMDFTIKWWDNARWQSVVDHFKDQVTFVQVGELQHHHPALNGVIDLRGKTDLRQLIRLVYHSDGILCGVTSLMHLAAAVEYRRNPRGLRPCIVVAGGREPVQWEAYPGHQFLHTIGMLPCCANGGCWKARTVPIGDRDEKDQSLCVDTVTVGKGKDLRMLPRCMDMISPNMVIEALERYRHGCPWLRNDDSKKCHKASKHSVIRKEIRVVGLRESGMPAIVNWIAGLHSERICAIHDVNHRECIAADEPCANIASIPVRRRAALDEQKNLLLLSYEECCFDELKKAKLLNNAKRIAGARRDVLILRDPYNTWACRVIAFRNNPTDLNAKTLVYHDSGGIDIFLKLWKNSAEEFLAITSLGSIEDGLKGSGRCLTILYNLWCVEQDYRTQIARSLGTFPSWNPIASDLTNSAAKCQMTCPEENQRWKSCLGDALFNQIKLNREIESLSKKLFPDIAELFTGT